MNSTYNDSQPSDSIRKGTLALDDATMSISKELITTLNQNFPRCHPSTGTGLYFGWLNAKSSVLQKMGYDENCDPCQFSCTMSVEPVLTDENSRIVSLDYSGVFFRKNEKAESTGESKRSGSRGRLLVCPEIERF